MPSGMPWSWGKKEAASAPQPAMTETPAASGEYAASPATVVSDAPLPADTRFRVDAVYTITGTGCVLVGEVEQGSIRPPVSMRAVRVVDGAETSIPVQVVSAMAHHKQVAELLPGVPAGLQLRGIKENRALFARERYPVAKGDRLVSP